MPAFASVSPLGLTLFGCLGLALIVFSLRVLRARRGAAGTGANLPRELDRLLADIGRGLRALSARTRSGGRLHRDKQAEVGRLLAEMQVRLRQLDDGSRQRYEARAGQVLVDAARVGITLPPWEMPLLSGRTAR